MRRLKITLLLVLFTLPCLVISSCKDNNDNNIKEDYTIIFNLMGGEYNDTTESVKVEAKMNERIEPITPTKSGYIFSGWSSSLDEVMTNDVDFSKPINESKVVYAIWKRNTIEYELNGGYFTKYESIDKLCNDFISDFNVITECYLYSFFWQSWGDLEDFFSNSLFYTKWKPLLEYLRTTTNNSETIMQIESLINRTVYNSDYNEIRLYIHAFLNQYKMYGSDAHYRDYKPFESFETPDFGNDEILDKVWAYYKDTAPSFFDNSKDYILPVPRMDGKTFMGWYDNPECTGEKVTYIPAGTTENKKYYCLWQ